MSNEACKRCPSIGSNSRYGIRGVVEGGTGSGDKSNCGGWKSCGRKGCGVRLTG